jgi:hypothetical protein
MKSLTTLLVLLFTFTANAQSPYRPLPTSGAEWIEFHHWLRPDGTQMNCDRIITSSTDTLIGSVIYHRLRSTGNCWGMEAPGFPVAYDEANENHLLFREDALERKVYAYDTATESEELYIDFSASTVEYTATYPMAMDTLFIWATDSLELVDGWHRTVDLGYSTQAQIPITVLIEGIGSTAGMDIRPDGLSMPYFDLHLLHCHSVDGVLIYSYGSTCDLTTSIRSVDRLALGVQPNPVEDECRITGLPLGDYRYVVSDALGTRVSDGRLLQSKVDCSSWEPGAYIIRLQDGEGRSIGSLRVIKL